MVLFGDSGIHVGELARVTRTVVWRYTDTYEQHACAGRLGKLHHFREIFFCRGARQAAQAVVRAYLENHHAGMMNFQCAWQPLQAPAAGLTAYAGVDDLVSVTLCLQSLRKQRNPTLLWPNPVGGTKAVA